MLVLPPCVMHDDYIVRFTISTVSSSCIGGDSVVLNFRLHCIVKKCRYFEMVLPSGNFCCLKNVSLARDNGKFNHSNTDVVEKVNFMVAASQHSGGRILIAC